MKQRIAASLVGMDEEELRTMLEGLQAETTDALENLRDLARGSTLQGDRPSCRSR